MKHSCIKCSMVYESEDVEAYYCPDCLEVKKTLAAEIDQKFKGRKRPKKVSDWDTLEKGGQIQGKTGYIFSPSARGINTRGHGNQ